MPSTGLTYTCPLCHHVQFHQESMCLTIKAYPRAGGLGETSNCRRANCENSDLEECSLGKRQATEGHTGPCCMLLMTITKRKQDATHRMEVLGALTTLDNLCSCPVSCFSFHPSLSARLRVRMSHNRLSLSLPMVRHPDIHVTVLVCSICLNKRCQSILESRDLNHRHFFAQFLQAGHPRSRCQRV